MPVYGDKRALVLYKKASSYLIKEEMRIMNERDVSASWKIVFIYQARAIYICLRENAPCRSAKQRK